MFKNNHKLRVVYHDTDAEGVAYYGSYLAWIEAGRGEYMRELGFPVKNIKEQFGIIFAVKKVTFEYLSPARYDDLLSIISWIDNAKRASLTFYQEIYRDNALLAKGEVLLVCLNCKTFKPCSIPEKLVDKISKISG